MSLIQKMVMLIRRKRVYVFIIMIIIIKHNNLTGYIPVIPRVLRATAYMLQRVYATPIPFVRPSVHLSHACIVSKQLNLSSKFFHHLIGPSFQFFVTKGRCVNLRASPPAGAPNTRGQQFSTNMRLYLGKDRGIVTMEDEYKVVCALSNSATFDDLE